MGIAHAKVWADTSEGPAAGRSNAAGNMIVEPSGPDQDPVGMGGGIPEVSAKPPAFLSLDEGEQVGVEHICMRRQHAVRIAFVHLRVRHA